MKRPVVTIKEPDGYIRRTILPYYVYKDAGIDDVSVMIQFIKLMARNEAGNGTVLDIEWMGEEEL